MPAIKKESDVRNPLSEAIKSIRKEHKLGDEASQGLVDIITFCKDPHYLALDVDLWLGQRIILKCFYMGSMGNEDLKLTKEEWEWLYEKEEAETKDDIVYENNMKDVIKKMLHREKNPDAKVFKELQLVLGRRGSKCHEETQIISTTAGSITFVELLERLNNKEKVGICTYDQKTLKRKITYDILSEDNGVVDCFQLETKRGLRETSSYNHPYLIWRDGWEKPDFVAISELKEGDKIAVADKTELFGKGGIGSNKAALLGYLQGDGGVTHSIKFTTASDIILEDFKRLVRIEFNNRYVVKHVDNYDYSVVKKSDRFAQNGSQKNEIKEWLSSINCFGKKSIDKVVPEPILKGNKLEVASFVSRLFACDGWATTEKIVPDGHGDKPKSLIGYSSSSIQLIDGIRHLLLKFGIHSTVTKNRAKCGDKEFDSWKLIISNSEDIQTFVKEIDIFSKEDKTLEALNMSLSRGEKNGQFHCMGSSDVRWDEVKIVNYVGKKRTIAIEVKETHVIGTDFVSHNTFMASLITAYEAYKLLIINDGDPHSYYKLPQGDEIAIINVALSQQQAGRLFGQIQTRISQSPFFAGRVAKETTSEIRLFTDKDLERKAKGVNLTVPGSILLLCGHSNPDSLAGYSAIMILFDEIAFYDETGKVTGKKFYGRLKPSLSKFFHYDAGRVVQISSPNAKMGIFYETWEQAKTEADILSFQLPTWAVNPDVSYDEDELRKDRKTNLELFTVEYGAQWASGGTYGYYFEPGLVDRCIRGDLGPHTRPVPGFNYYLHVDPANGGNNYAAVLVAKKRYVNHMGKKRNQIYLAGTWVWRPTPGVGLLFTEIDKDVIQICQQFRPVMVTYDDYQSKQSLERLQSCGVRTKRLMFNRNVKNKIYQNLTDLMTYIPKPELLLYDDGGESSLLLGELRSLKKKQIQRGISIIPDKNSDIKTDDLADCLAGCCTSANDGLRMSLPEPVSVNMGFR